MKVPTRKLMKAAAKRRFREGPSEGQQTPALKRPAVRVPEPPAPQEPPTAPEIDLKADTQPERAVVEGVTAEEPVSEEPAIAKEPPVPIRPVPAKATRSWGEGPSGAASPPPEQTPASSPPCAVSETAEAVGGNGARPRRPRDSILDDGRWAERLISSILVPEVQEELSHLRAATFFRESYAALVKIANSLAATREVIHGGKTLMREAQKEAEEARARAEAVEKALESARTARADEIKAAESRAEVEANRLRAALSQLMEAESAVMARDLHISELTASIQTAENRASEAEERAKKAEEETGRALEDERAAAASLAVEKEARAVEVEAAVEARAARTIEEFMASERFMDELAEASLEAYLQGF